MNVKGGGNVLHAHSGKLAEANSGGFELLAVARGGSGSWSGHGALL